MKDFRRLCFAIILTAAFTVPALAGEIHTPGAPDPGAPDPGEIQTPGAPAPGDMSAPPSAQGVTHGPGTAGEISTPGLAFLLFAIQCVLD